MARKKIETKTNEKCQCISCVHSTLYQWGTDPVIAECKLTGEREVANSIILCDNHEKAKVLPKPVKHFPNDYITRILKHGD